MMAAATQPLPHWHALAPHVKHLIIAGLVIALVWVGIVRGQDLWIRLKTLDLQKSDQALQEARASLLSAQSQRAEADQRWAQLVSEVQKQNSALSRQVRDRDAALRASQNTLQNATPSDVLARLQAASGLGSSDASLTSGGLSLSDSGARRVTGQLETEVVEKADLADTQKQLAGVESELGGANTVIESLRKESASKDVVLAKQVEECKAEVSLVKAKARKKNFITSTVTYIGGIISGVLLGRRM